MLGFLVIPHIDNILYMTMKVDIIPGQNPPILKQKKFIINSNEILVKGFIFLNNYYFYLRTKIFISILYYLFNIIRNIMYKNGDWGLGIGDWGLGIEPNTQSHIPHSQSS